jgi:tripartite-type tricarboxylate transporter receptor subunit TctC
MFITILSVAGPQAEAGKVRLLAWTTPQRSRFLPNLPTLSESGLPGYEMVGWNGLVAPLGTPPAIIAKLNAEVQRALKQPDVQQQLASIGMEAPDPGITPERFSEFLKAQAATWVKLVKDSGARID